MTPNPLRIGLLPFYLKLYDEVMPECRAKFVPFLDRIAAGFRQRGLTVETAPVCRVAEEFQAAIDAFEGRVDAVVTLHLAYSPSLEALDSFRNSRLPVILLDTTMDPAFGPDARAERILYNHGVHGVMDFASMLRRYRRDFEIVAGRADDPATFDKAVRYVRAARAVAGFRGARTLRVGEAFRGMGDFAVEESVLRACFGITVDEVGLEALDRETAAVSDREVEAELDADRRRYTCRLDEDVHRDSVRVGLGLRRLVDGKDYDAFSVNFQAFDRPDRPACTMPFLEICKAMARGKGYGGEGDILTAALDGALARGFGAATFTEIFCPDWAGETLFLSHMGEINPALAAEKPHLFRKKSFDGRSRDPAVLSCALHPGPAVFVNLAPGPDNQFSLIVAPVEVLPENDRLDPAMRDTVRAWIKPRRPVAEFLESYSRAGGTHHSVLVPGTVSEPLCAFGRQSGMEVVILE